MQAILDGTQQSLDRLVTFCERSANEALPNGWYLTHTSDGELEEEEEFSTLDSTQETLITPPREHLLVDAMVTAPVQHQNIPQENTSIVNNLNLLAQGRSSADLWSKILMRKPGTTPLWSPDPSEQDTHEEENIREIRQMSLLDDEDDWTIINQDLEANFTEEFPSAAKKRSRPASCMPRHPDIVHSIEAPEDPSDMFMVELLHIAAEKAPTPIETPTRRSH